MDEETSPYLDFASNLRRLVATKTSIAQVCRDLGMNRQQFNKYLSGNTFPAPNTLRKIAEYFAVDQRVLFTHPETNQKEPGLDAEHLVLSRDQIDRRIWDGLLETLSTSAQTKIKEGCHLIYYPWFQDPASMLVAVMVVFRVGHITCFRRFTRFAMKDNLGSGLRGGSMRASLLRNMDELFLSLGRSGDMEN
jgi:transcriptional regulator with XRE-family HTH domain